MLSGGQHPFPAASKEELLERQHEGAPNLRQKSSDVPRSVDAVLEKALQSDPDKRYSSGGELAQALIQALPSDDPHGTGSARRPRTPPSGARVAVPVADRAPQAVGRWKSVASFLWRATKWVGGKVVAATFILLLVALALIISSSFLLSNVLKQRLSVQEWYFNGWEDGGESVVLERYLNEPLEEAVEPYALGAVTDLHAEFRQPDLVELYGLLNQRSLVLRIRLETDGVVPQVQLQSFNDVPLFIVGGIISDGVNEGLRLSWEGAPVAVTRLAVREEKIHVTLEPR
jgi:hypothetical protein